MGSEQKPTPQVVTRVGSDTLLQDILDGVEDSIAVVDSEHRVRFANSAALKKLGPESPIGKFCYQVLQNRNRPCGPPLWDCPLSRVLKSGARTTVIHPIRTAGTDTYVKTTPTLSGIAMGTSRR